LDLARKSFDKARRRQAARKDLTKRVRGLDQEEAERLVDVIWAEHDLAPPLPALRRILVERALGTRSRTEDLELTADILLGAGKWVSNIFGMISEDKTTAPFDSVNGFRIPNGGGNGSGHIQVLLDPDVQPRLTAMGDKSIFVTSVATLVNVALRSGPDDELEVWEREPTLSDNPIRLGHLTSEDAAPFRRYVKIAERAGQVAITHGLRGDGPEGGWNLYLSLPGEQGV
jgi:hypothetical protein